jgi:DNA mismatch repair ATPase MutS
MSVVVQEDNGSEAVTFLYKVTSGTSAGAFAMQCAKHAGMLCLFSSNGKGCPPPPAPCSSIECVCLGRQTNTGLPAEVLERAQQVAKALKTHTMIDPVPRPRVLPVNKLLQALRSFKPAPLGQDATDIYALLSQARAMVPSTR